MKRSLRALRSVARKPGTILTAIVLLAAGTAFGFAVPLLHKAPPARTTAAVPGRLSAELDALEQARLTGRTVPVSSLTTEVSQTVANPDGTLTNTTYVVPVRVRQHGAWVPVSATLRRDASGSWQPAAVPSGVTLSGGGTGPLATMTSVTGQQLSLAFPARLPTPVVSGDTATYKSVWPGTDLQVTVSSLGGLTWTVITENAAAAANPALRDLNLGISGPGLTVASSQGGSLMATGPGHAGQFSGPPTTMWDSRTGPPAPLSRRDMGAPRRSTAMGPGRAARIALIRTRLTGRTLRLTPATSMLSPSTSYPVYLSSSIAPDATMPPARGQASTMASRTGIKLSAYTSSPTNCGTVQNQNEACSGSGNGFTEVQQGCPTTVNYDVEQGAGTSYPGNGIGYNWWNSCIGVFRSYYQFNTSSLISTLTSASGYSTGSIKMWVQSATLYAWVRYGADWGCTDTWPVHLDLSAPINSGTDWNNKPGTDASDQEKSTTTPPGPNPSSSCAQQTIDFDVTYAIADAVNSTAGSLTFRLTGDETASSSSSNVGFLRIGDNPDIITVFDLNPPAPTNLATSPSGQYEPGGPASYGCGASTGNLPWIDAVDSQQTTNSSGAAVSQFDLKATLSPGIPGEPVEARYKMWDNGTAIPSSEVTGNAGASQNWFTLAAGATQVDDTPINFLLKDGEQYTWTAQEFVSGIPQGSDPGYWSAEPAKCGFNVDMTPPTAPSVSSTSFPQLGSTKTSLAAGTNTGTFTFTSSDPTSANCAECLASGVYEFAYSLNNEDALGSLENTTQVGCHSSTATPTSGVIQASSGSATSCPVEPTLWGTNILYVAAVDKAGNVSTVTAYYFYVPWDPNKHPVPGDVNGDGIPDLLATGTGGLTLYQGNTDLAISTSPASTDAESPDGSSWANYQITHRGPVNQLSASGNVDDLYAHKSGGASLYLYQNHPAAPGTSPQFSDTSAIVPVQRPACSGSDCSGYASTWSSVTQILSPGDAWNPTATADDTTDSGIPSLITVEDVNGSYELWAFQGNYAPGLQDPVELGSSGWNNITLAAPGYVDGRLTIWAYDNTSGKLYSYPIYLVNGVPSLSSGSNTPIAAEQGSPSFTYPYAHSGVVVASPGPIDMNTTPDASSATNANLPGLFIATPPAAVFTPTRLELTSGGVTAEDSNGSPNPSGATIIQGSVYDPNQVTSTICANGCLWYYPGQESSSGTYSLSTTPQFVGDLPAPVKQLS